MEAAGCDGDGISISNCGGRHQDTNVRGEEVARERNYSQWLLRLCSCSQRSDILATAPCRDGGLESVPVTGDALHSHESRPH